MDPRRISVRPFQLSDVDDFYSWASDDKVTRYLRWDTIHSRDEALAYLRDVAIPHPCRWSICADDRSIGYVSLRPAMGDDKCRANLSYAVATDHWGRGICTAVLRKAIPLFFEKFPYLVRIQALVETENVGSQKVLEKVGFVKEGLLRRYGYNKGEIRDMFMFSFLSTDHIR